MQFSELISRFPAKVVRDLAETQQPLEHHPEGDVLTHTKLVFEKVEQKSGDLELKIAAVFHDLGKIDATFVKSGRIVSYGHEHKSLDYISYYKHLFPEVTDWDKIRFIVRNHMKMHLLTTMRPFKVEQLKNSPYWEELLIFAACDREGRGA